MEMSHRKLEPVGLNGSVEGTTEDVYTDALDWWCPGFGPKVILLENTTPPKMGFSLDYKVLISALHGGVEREQTPETALGVADVAREILNQPYDRVRVQVKSTVGAAPADYSLEYIGHPPGGREAGVSFMEED